MRRRRNGGIGLCGASSIVPGSIIDRPDRVGNRGFAAAWGLAAHGRIRRAQSSPQLTHLARNRYFRGNRGVLSAIAIWLFALFTLGLPLLLHPQNWLAWILVYMSFAVLFLDRKLRSDKVLHIVVCIVILVHQVVSFAGYIWGPMVEGNADAQFFHQRAVTSASMGSLEFNIGYLFYENLLGSVYSIGGPSKLIGQSLSVLAMSLSISVFIRFLHLFRIEAYAALPVALFGLWPSGLMYTTGTYREAFELLFFAMALYGCMKLQSSSEYRWFLFTLLSVVGLSIWHKALIVFGMPLIVLILFFTWLRKSRLKTEPTSMRLPIVVGVSIIGVTLLALSATDVGKALVLDSLSGSIIRNIVNYRNWVDNQGAPRTAFNIGVDTSSAFSLAGSFARMYAYYMFAPFSGGVTDVKDVYAVLESSTRLVLVVLAVMSTWAKHDRLDFIILWCVYFAMTFMWALGTTNYGQAIRHHVLTNWILIVMAWPAALYLIQSLCKRSLSQDS